MLLYIYAAMARLQVDEATFFQLAHIYVYGVRITLSTEVQEFRVCGIVPDFVSTYVQHLEVI
mgnify:FL=1